MENIIIPCWGRGSILIWNVAVYANPCPYICECKTFNKKRSMKLLARDDPRGLGAMAPPKTAIFPLAKIKLKNFKM